MNKRLYTFWMTAAMLMALLISTDLLAQRGRYHRGPYRGYYPRYAPVRPFFNSGPFVSINFGGMPYRYQGGFFYRPFGTAIRVVVPPVGIVINTMPRGYRRVYAGPDLYYYYNGIYYRPQAGRGYEVVAPPLGAELDQLPPGARVTVIDGQKYYELNGTFYEETVNERGEAVYLVAGTDGVLNTTSRGMDENDSTVVDVEDEDQVPATEQPTAGPQIGDKLDNLPAGPTSVVIRGETLYLSPAGFYYRQIVEGRKTLYEVVGK